MGLALARVGTAISSALDKPLARFATGSALAATATTGVVLGSQFAYGTDIRTVQSRPTAANWTIGAIGTATGAAFTIAHGYRWYDGHGAERLGPKAATFLSGGAAAGAVLGAFVIAPAIRRMLSDQD